MPKDIIFELYVLWFACVAYLLSYLTSLIFFEQHVYQNISTQAIKVALWKSPMGQSLLRNIWKSL